ncbi:hypothetical protein [Pseudobacter ginsenosidimutans]|uniref:Uncharacterized protein n=1 Tax=Pseudobacter ginsenosidimutans TaxID=661488 RepID=A0A4Q7N2P6_9BACT|nr:hypothetical protein [Pseudobacter ginsenosidimutans]QEC43799.1 hypothetical protein FSB84_19735 [Pseudobacter ginsenosidimutans]RZS75219.1 hypothetical protein EV199_1081 [Pseudobacter ginsenosidimutans]
MPAFFRPTRMNAGRYSNAAGHHCLAWLLFQSEYFFPDVRSNNPCFTISTLLNVFENTSLSTASNFTEKSFVAFVGPDRLFAIYGQEGTIN